jgi:hypothetical protein
LRQQRDLHVRRPRVAIVQFELFNRLCLCFHKKIECKKIVPQIRHVKQIKQPNLTTSKPASAPFAASL